MDDSDDRELADVRWELDRLAAQRLAGPLDRPTTARYERLARRECELLRKAAESDGPWSDMTFAPGGGAGASVRV